MYKKNIIDQTIAAQSKHVPRHGPIKCSVVELELVSVNVPIHLVNIN